MSIRRLKDSVFMEIKDDGKSFDVNKALTARGNLRLGLVGMKERIEMVGGNLTIESIPGVGTTLLTKIPVRGLAYPNGREEDSSKGAEDSSAIQPHKKSGTASPPRESSGSREPVSNLQLPAV
jgi:hypothetical protein